MQSHLRLMLEQIWVLYMNNLMVLNIINWRDYCFETCWDMLMVNFLDLMKESN